MSRFAPAGASDEDYDSEEDCFEFFDNIEGETPLAKDISHHDSAKSSSNLLLNQQVADKSTTKNTLLLHDLQTSSTHGDVEAVIRLVKEIGDPNVLLNSGWTSLMYSAYFAQVEVVKALIENGASIVLSNNKNVNALHAACKSNAKSQVVQVKEIVIEFLKTGADILAVDMKGRTPMMYAARGGLLDIVKIFVELDNKLENLLKTDDRGWTAADWAAAYGRLDVLICLLDSGALLNSSSPSFQAWPKQIIEYINSKESSLYEKDSYCSSISASKSNDIKSFSENESMVHVTDSSSENFDTNASENENTSLNKPSLFDYDEMDFPVRSKESTSNSQTSQESGKQNVTGNAIEEKQDDIHLPAIFVRERLDTEEFETFGQLELFLLGLDLARLIPLFKEHDIVFEQLLCLSNDDLETIGITALGTRKRIMSAISECHLKHTKSSDLLDYTNTALTFERMMTLMSGASEQVAYIASCMKYISHHIEMYPDALEANNTTSYDVPPVDSFKEKIEDVTKSIFSLSKALKCVKLQTRKIVENAPAALLVPPDMVCVSTNDCSNSGSQVWVIVGLSALYVAVSWGRKFLKW